MRILLALYNIKINIRLFDQALGRSRIGTGSREERTLLKWGLD